MSERPISVLERLEASDALEVERGVRRWLWCFRIAAAFGWLLLAIDLAGVLPSIVHGGWQALDLQPQVYRPARAQRELHLAVDLGFASFLLAFTLVFGFRKSNWRSFAAGTLLVLSMAIIMFSGYLQSGLTSTMLPLTAPLLILGSRGAVHVRNKLSGRPIVGG